MTRVCLGGTFDAFHRGHRALLDTAFAAGDEVVVGVTTDAFANQGRVRRVRPYAQRVAGLEKHAASAGRRVEVRPIDSPFGFALEPDFDVIAVTPETVGGATRINDERANLGLSPLAAALAPYILADDGRPVKATRVVAGEIDVDGHLLRAARVAVGSANPVKVEAVRRAVLRVHEAAEVQGFDVASGVPDQPWEDETWKGARIRAEAALAAWPEADFGVGVEAGLFEAPVKGLLMDVQVCVAVDAGGRETLGHGPGFTYPRAVSEALRGGRTVGDVMSEAAGEDDIGRKQGAIGWLTHDRWDRRALTEPAVLAAFVPRMRPEFHDL